LIKIEDFRPKININNQILYLNQFYSSLIEEFLLKGKDESRKLFLEKYFEINTGGRIFYPRAWYFEPYYTCEIIFDDKMEYAKIEYGLHEACYFKIENGTWTFISHVLEYQH
jgi:hypothetical protein